MPTAPRDLLRRMFDAAIEAAQPAHCVPPHLPPAPRGRLVVIGAGKASAEMARAVEDHWPGELSGLVVTRYGYAVPCRKIEIVEAAHPVPDEAGLSAARRLLQLVSGLSADDLVLCLISGGGSALLPLPIEPLTLEHKQSLSRALLKSGASINEMNCVRRHLSAIKGGRLAAACHPAHVLTLAISDVPGDDPINIASGPTAADPTTCEDALAIVRRYGIELPPEVREVLEGGRGESVKPGDPRLARAEIRLVATPQLALQAAAKVAREAGVLPLLLGDSIEGEARDVGKVMAGIAKSVARHGQPVCAPCVLRHRARPGPWRPERRVPSVDGGRPGGPARRLGARRRYRRRRRCRGSRRGDRHARHDGARLGQGHPTRGPAHGQRRARLLRSARRPGDHRADQDQRQRFPRGAGAGIRRLRAATFGRALSELAIDVIDDAGG
jgi:glycerate 2-kinase